MHDHFDIHSEEVAIKKVQWLFEEWSARLLRGSTAHFVVAAKLEFWDRFWSITNLTVAISVLFLAATQGLSGAYQDALATQPDTGLFVSVLEATTQLSILLPLLSLAVVLSSAFQYVSDYSGRAARHRRAAIEYANLRRKLERYWTKPTLHGEAIHSISRTYNTVARFAPLVPDRTWDNIGTGKQREIDRIRREFFSEPGDPIE